MHMTDQKAKRRAMAGVALAVLFWAVNTVLAKGVSKTIPPMTLSFYRWVIAVLFLLPQQMHIWSLRSSSADKTSSM